MVNREADNEAFEGKWYEHQNIRSAIISGSLIGVAYGLGHSGMIPSYSENILFTVAIAIGGYYWIKEGFEKLLNKEISIEMLMLVAAVGAIILNEWDEAAFLAFLYGAAEGVEHYAYSRTRSSIRALLDRAPKEARIMAGGTETMVPAERLRIGDIFILRPGEGIPTDGVIVKGRSSINEASVTGETMPVEKKEGMKVFASTINQEGALEISVTTTYSDNTLSKIIHMVEEAQDEKGKTQLLIERFGSRYSPLVLLSALALIAIPPLFGGSLSYWGTRAVVLLVAAAPCALVMSMPVAIAAGIGKAGNRGVLIKGGGHLEDLGKINVVAFDKTGTLTKGEPIITDIIPINGSESDVLRKALCIEKSSEHPLAKAIVQKAKDLGIQHSDEASNVCDVVGFGAKGEIGDGTLYVGKPALFKSVDEASYAGQISEFRGEGKTVILVGSADRIDGIIAVSDELRPSSKQVISELRAAGIQTIMLTGDNEITAKAVAEQFGIDEIQADLKPEDKINAIKNLEQKHGAVIMVGDGINDAPALAQATVGVAMGGAGTDTAIEAANVVLMADDIAKLPWAIRLGKKARKISLQNIVFSVIVLSILIPSALSGVMSVTLAVFFHEASELLAVGNGLRVAQGE